MPVPLKATMQLETFVPLACADTPYVGFPLMVQFDTIAVPLCTLTPLLFPLMVQLDTIARQ